MNPFRVDNEIGEDKFVVMYAGNIGLSQGLEIILGAAERLRHEGSIAFVIVGGGSSLMTSLRGHKL